MSNSIYFKDLLETIPNKKKIVLLMCLLENDDYFKEECGFLKHDIFNLNSEFKNILLEQNEEYLAFIKNQEESIIERILNK